MAADVVDQVNNCACASHDDRRQSTMTTEHCVGCSKYTPTQLFSYLCPSAFPSRRPDLYASNLAFEAWRIRDGRAEAASDQQGCDFGFARLSGSLSGGSPHLHCTTKAMYKMSQRAHLETEIYRATSPLRPAGLKRSETHASQP